MDEITQLLDKINKQAAILAYQIDMLQLHHSIAVIRHSLLKVPSKTAPTSLSATAAAPSIAADTPLPSSLSTAATHPPFTASPTPPTLPSINSTSTTTAAIPPLPLSLASPTPRPIAATRSTPPSFPSDQILFSKAYTIQSTKPTTATTLLLQAFHQTTRVPSQLVTNSPYKLVSFFQTMSLMKRLVIASEFVHISKLISGYYGLNANYKHELFGLTQERNGKKRVEKALFVFDPGGTFTVESIFDLEDKVDLEGMVMIRYCDTGCSSPSPPAATNMRTIHTHARHLD